MSKDSGQWLESKRVMCQILRTQRAVKLQTSLMARTQCQTEYIAMVKSGNECQFESYMSHDKLASVVNCAEVLIEPSFLVLKSASPGECVTERTTEQRHTLCCLARVARTSLRHHYTRTSRIFHFCSKKNVLISMFFHFVMFFK